MPVFNWKSAPFIRLILPMLAGIIPAIYLELSTLVFSVAFIALSIASALIWISTKQKPSLNKEILFGLISTLTLISFGFALVILNTDKNNPKFYGNHLSKENTIAISVIEMPKQKPNSIQVIGDILSINTENGIIEANGQALFYFEKDSASKSIIQGDELICKVQLNEISPIKNPGQFNYKQYLYFNQIYHQGYVNAANWVTSSSNNFNALNSISKLRDNLLDVLEQNGLSGDELSVASALILGYKEDLDPELKHSYSSAGATHVLAVSGLHVGIIYLVIQSLLKLFDRNEKWKWFRLIITLSLLWFYALLTGLSPSVIRAATMFSFVAYGKTTDRTSNIYNTLAASAFLLLLFNPFLVMEVGFQLSYLAVLGIVYFQKKIYNLFYIPNMVGDYIWKITSVSIAAQLTTFPLGLLYFHQFPTYFFISNLVVIPGAMIIIGLGILVFSTSWVPSVSFLIGTILSAIIHFMNSVVIWIDTMPFALIESISITILMSWLLYWMILSFAISIESRKLKYFNISIILIITFIVIDHNEDLSLQHHTEVCIYSIKNEPNINFISPNYNLIIANPSLTASKSNLLFNVKHHWFDLDAKSEKCYSWDDTISENHLLKSGNLIQFKDQLILYVDDSSKLAQNLDIDLLYLDAPSKYICKEILERNSYNHLILGYNINRNVKTELINSGKANIHNLRDEAFILKLE